MFMYVLCMLQEGLLLSASLRIFPNFLKIAWLHYRSGASAMHYWTEK